MRSLIILKGLVKRDKLEWVRREGLDNFLLDLGNIRSLFYKPDYKGGGRDYLVRSHDDLVYKVFIQSLCTRLSTGLLVVVDPENESVSGIEDLATIFGYTVFYHVESIPSDYVGKNRRYVNPKFITPGRDTLEKEVEQFNSINLLGKTVVNTYSEVEDFWREGVLTLGDSDTVMLVGDLHSHWSLLKKLPVKKKFTVFLGDYVDGPEAGGSRLIIDKILNSENRKMKWIEGNHELRLRRFLGWSYMKSKGRRVVSEVLEEGLSQEFMRRTAPEFEDIKGDCAMEYLIAMNAELQESLTFNHAGRTYVCTHAGLRWMEQVSPKFIGNAIYSGKNVERVDLGFSNTYYGGDIWSIHGHCKYPDLKFRKYPGVVNLDTEDDGRINYAVCKPSGKIKIGTLYDDRRKNQVYPGKD